MTYNPRTRLHHCDSCDRAMNSPVDLVEMRKPGVMKAMNICSKSMCFEKATEAGYLSWAERQRRSEGGST